MKFLTELSSLNTGNGGGTGQDNRPLYGSQKSNGHNYHKRVAQTMSTPTQFNFNGVGTPTKGVGTPTKGVGTPTKGVGTPTQFNRVGIHFVQQHHHRGEEAIDYIDTPTVRS
jgi:hypothetical protein